MSKRSLVVGLIAGLITLALQEAAYAQFAGMLGTSRYAAPPIQYEPKFVAAVPGVQYITLPANEFQPFYDSTYNNTGMADVVYCVTPGTFSSFTAATIPLPNGAVIVSAEFEVIDNNAVAGIQPFLYQIDLTTNTFTPIGAVASSGNAFASPSPLNLIATGLPSAPVDTTMFAYVAGVTFGACNANLGFIGARIGYIGPSNAGGNDMPAGTLYYLPVGDRFVDTRINLGGRSTPFVNGDTTDFVVTGVTGRDGKMIPVGATAVVGNVTAVLPTGNGFFRILPGGTPTTIGTSTVNFNAGFTTANNFTARLDGSGQLRAYFLGAGAVDLLIDIVGYYR